MSAKAPRRFKRLKDMSPDDFAERLRTGEMPETREFALYRLDNPDLFNDTGLPRDPDDWTPEDHANRKHGGTRQ